MMRNSLLLVLPLLFTAVACNNDECNVTFSSHPESIQAHLGDNVTFQCDISGDEGLNRAFVQYSFNGSTLNTITGNERSSNERGFFRDRGPNGQRSILKIVNVAANHTGIYGCSAVPDLPPCDGTVTIFSMNATLTIIGRPSITSDTIVFRANTTTDLTISSISITGTTPVTSVYRIGDSGDMQEVSVEHPSRFQTALVGTQFQLVITDVRRADAGEYMILATNEFGEDRFRIMVEVVGPDRPMVIVPSVAVSQYNTPLSVECRVQDDAVYGSVSFRWHDEQDNVISQGALYSLDSTLSSSTLTITTVTRNITGMYTCHASNDRDTDSGVVRVFGPPPPLSVRPRIVGSGRSRTVTWSRPSAANSVEPILKYKIGLFIEGSDMVIREKTINVTQNHDEVVCAFENLDPNMYEVRITPISVVDGMVVLGAESEGWTFSVEGTNDTQIIAIAVGVVAGLAILIAIGTAICIFFLCFYYPHRRQLQSQQQTWSREDVKTDGVKQNEYTSLTLRPSSNYPPSPGMTSPTSSQFLADIDPKWEFPRENIKLSDALCEGQFTVLYRGIATGIKEKPLDIAVKTVRDDATEDDIKALVAEMELLSGIGPHDNIVSMIRVCTVGKPMYMVMEYMCHGDLLGFLRASRGHHGRYTVSPGLGYQPPAINLYPRDLLNIGAKIANGMRYLADRKLVHRALCAKNVLVGSNMSIKIYNVGSFDMAFESRDYILKWLAPETLFDQTATTYSDVWSFGVTLWELVTVGGSPYGEIQPEDLYSQLMNGMRMPCPQHCAQEIHDLMLDCWRRNPMDRPHFSVIHEKLEDLAASKISLLDFQNYDVYVYSQFEEPMALSTVL